MRLVIDPRKPVFDAIRAARGSIAAHEVAYIDDLLDRLQVPRAVGTVGLGPPAFVKRRIGPAGTALIQEFEKCARLRSDGRFEAYPDPASGGAPWTIGWGSTGPGIAPGTVWTRQQCDDRFWNDLRRCGDEVEAALAGAPTTQAQFDALTSFHYNSGKIRTATLTRFHREGRFTAAAAQFGKWIYAAGKKSKGLIRRRAAEAALYRSS